MPSEHESSSQKSPAPNAEAGSFYCVKNFIDLEGRWKSHQHLSVFIAAWKTDNDGDDCNDTSNNDDSNDDSNNDSNDDSYDDSNTEPTLTSSSDTKPCFQFSGEESKI